MKTLLLMISILLMTGSVFASGQEQQAEILYREGKYQEAADLYKQILSEGKESAELYYNLGNCYFKEKENTLAILNYERALLLNPSDEMARYNLKMAQNATVDKIEVLPELFLVRWYKGMETYFSADQWGYISVGLFILSLVMVVLFFYSPSVLWKKAGFIAGIVFLMLTLGAFYFAVRQNSRMNDREYAIVMTPSVTVKGAPDSSGTDLFLIHEGLKVRVVGMLGDWYNIRLTDGNEGWLRKSDIKRI